MPDPNLPDPNILAHEFGYNPPSLTVDKRKGGPLGNFFFQVTLPNQNLVGGVLALAGNEPQGAKIQFLFTHNSGGDAGVSDLFRFVDEEQKEFVGLPFGKAWWCNYQTFIELSCDTETLSAQQTAIVRMPDLRVDAYELENPSATGDPNDPMKYKPKKNSGIFNKLKRIKDPNANPPEENGQGTIFELEFKDHTVYVYKFRGLRLSNGRPCFQLIKIRDIIGQEVNLTYGTDLENWKLLRVTQARNSAGAGTPNPQFDYTLDYVTGQPDPKFKNRRCFKITAPTSSLGALAAEFTYDPDSDPDNPGVTYFFDRLKTIKGQYGAVNTFTYKPEPTPPPGEPRPPSLNLLQSVAVADNVSTVQTTRNYSFEYLNTIHPTWVTKATDAINAEREYTPSNRTAEPGTSYDPLILIDERDTPTTYDFKGWGGTTTVTDALGSYSQDFDDDDGTPGMHDIRLLMGFTARNGAHTTLRYDESPSPENRGNLTTIIRPSSNGDITDQFVYNVDTDNLISANYAVGAPSPAPKSFVLSYQDPIRPDLLLTKIHDNQLGVDKDIRYDSSGRPDQITDFNQNIIGIGYDHDWNLNTVTVRGKTTTYSHDDRYLVTTVNDGESNVISSVLYDNAYRVKSMTKHGIALSFDYNAFEMTSSGDPNGTTNFTFDTSTRTLTATGPNGTYVSTFDHALNLTAFSDARQKVTTYPLYDILNRVKEIWNPGATSASRRINYDFETDNGVIYDTVTVTDEDSKQTKYRLDARGLLAQINYMTDPAPAGGIVDLGYDERGRMKTMNDLFAAWVWDYTESNGETTVVQTMTPQAEGTDTQQVTVKHDAEGRLKRIDYPQLPSPLTARSLIYEYFGATNQVEFIKDASQVVLAQFYFENANTLPSRRVMLNGTGVETVYGWETGGTYRLNDITHKKSAGGADLIKFTYGQYNPVGNLAQLTRTTYPYPGGRFGSGSSVDYGYGQSAGSYPTMNQLLSETYKLVNGTEFLKKEIPNPSSDLDLSGNRLNYKITEDGVYQEIAASPIGPNDLNQIKNLTRTFGGQPSPSWLTTFDFDGRGNQKLMERVAGGGEDSLKMEVDFNQNNNPIQFKLTTFSVVRRINYNYNGFGFRTRKYVRNDEVLSRITQYIMYGNTLLMEQDVSTDGNFTITPKTLFLPGLGLVSFTGENNATEKTRFFLPDGFGNVIALINKHDEEPTTTEPQITGFYQADASGNLLLQPGDLASYGAEPLETEDISTTTNPFHWNGLSGYYFDEDLGLYLLGLRWYDPKTGRFLTRDPIGFAGGDANLYGYVRGNPLNSVDPLGLDGVVDELLRTDIYEEYTELAAQGYQKGGFLGNLQGIWFNAASALLDTIGGRTVKSLSEKSGTASGEGRTAAAVGWGTLAVGDILLEAFSFGRMGQMLRGTAGKKGVLEFSHSIPKRMGGPRAWWNGTMVTPYVHAMSDPYRFLKGMTAADKWPFLRQMVNRMPSWAQGVVGYIDTLFMRHFFGDQDPNK